MPFPEAWDSYARLVVTVHSPSGPFEISAAQVGDVGEWPNELPPPLYVMTAWDPGSERPGLEDNRQRQTDLEAELAPRVSGMWRASGRDPLDSSSDEGIAVVGIDVEEALSCARRYGQDAIFEWTPQRWSILSCGGEPRLDAGWVVAPSEAPTT